MAHFARLNETNQVISVEAVTNAVITDNEGNEQEQVGIDFLTKLNGGGWYKQTSYNGTFRNNYAGIGFTYDPTRDAFIPPQPYPSWTLNEDTCLWEAPTLHPTDGLMYAWNENTLAWDEVTE
jgi:hypothetical protein